MKITLTPVREREQGSHLLAVGLIMVVVAVVGFVGYTVAAKKSPKASTNSTTTTAATEKTAADTSCVVTYHDANLCKFASHASLDKTAYKATIAEVNSDGTSNLTLESDGKGNASLDGTASGQTLNTVQLDGSSYLQTTPGGTWYEYPAGTSTPDSSTDPTSGMNLVLGSAITYKPLGTAACGNLTCFKYSVSTVAQPGTTQDVWFDNQQYLLREWKETDTTNDSTDMVISYPSSIVITKPAPVEPFTSMITGQ